MIIQPTGQGTRHRVPPRRRRPRRSIWRKTVWPLFKISTLIIALVFICTIVIGKVARPFRLLGTENIETKRLGCELSNLKKQNIELGRQINYLKTPQGTAQSARKLGYVKPGEISLVLPSDVHSNH